MNRRYEKGCSSKRSSSDESNCSSKKSKRSADDSDSSPEVVGTSRRKIASISDQEEILIESPEKNVESDQTEDKYFKLLSWNIDGLDKDSDNLGNRTRGVAAKIIEYVNFYHVFQTV